MQWRSQGELAGYTPPPQNENISLTAPHLYIKNIITAIYTL